ncbi:hypothetical protein DMC47_32400 [Nostoc sp. 3335mG]|nr:hypothetical protein DMC47_32400 [Nostoc sp. 3335mG]
MMKALSLAVVVGLMVYLIRSIYIALRRGRIQLRGKVAWRNKDPREFWERFWLDVLGITFLIFLIVQAIRRF